MVLEDLLGSKMTKNQAHISLEINIQAQPLHLTQQKALPKPLLVFMKTSVEWCITGVTDLYMTFFVLHFLWINETMSIEASACVQCSAVYTVSAFPLLRPHLFSVSCVKQFVNFSREKSFMHFASDIIDDILLRCDKRNI